MLIPTNWRLVNSQKQLQQSDFLNYTNYEKPIKQQRMK
jgi:hypothetical protein